MLCTDIIELKADIEKKTGKMLEKARNIAAGVLLSVSFYLSGCVSPLMYRNLDISSKEYKTLVRRTKEKETLRLEALLNNVYSSTKDFEIKSIRARDNKEVKYSRWMPKKSGKEVIVYLNGLESHGGWFSESAEKLVENGIEVYALDRRGSGINARLTGSYKDWIDDVHQLILKAKQDNPKADINLVSLCFGARVATGEAIKNPSDVKALVYISPGFDLKVDLNNREKSLVTFSVMSGINFPIASPIKKDEMFAKEKKYLEFISNDFLRTTSPNSLDFYEGCLLGDFAKKNIEKIKVPSLIFLAEKEEIIDNERTRQTFSQLKNVKFITYQDSEHTIFFGKEREKFVEDLVDFIEKN